MFNCKYCNKENKPKKNTYNLYCNNKCQGLFRWYNQTVPAIESNTAENVDVKTLKKYLLEFVGCNCKICGIPQEWNGLPLSLQLDHIDGNSDNNHLSNLRLLCPNCHSQTETFAGKSGKKKNTKRNSYLRKYKGYDSQVE